jgi:hypothetical protein
MYANMGIRMPARRTFALSLALATALVTSPSFAQDEGADYYDGAYEPAPLPPIPDAQVAQAGPAQIVGYSIEEREAWLAECRDRVGYDNGVGGAIIGGVIGGVAGNRIAGRGNRTVGTVVGAGVGAVAGAAIDKAEDRGAARGYCEDYLDRYEAFYANGGARYGYPAAGYGTAGVGAYPYAAPYSGRVMWLPVVVKKRRLAGCDCAQEQVIEQEVVRPAPAKRVIRYRRSVSQTGKYTKSN